MFGVNQRMFHPTLLPISCVCCSATANPLKLLYRKVSLLKQSSNLGLFKNSKRPNSAHLLVLMKTQNH